MLPNGVGHNSYLPQLFRPIMSYAKQETKPNQRRPERAITFLTQEEVQRLFSAIKTKRDRAIFAVAYRHGLRASEVGILQLTDVDMKAARKD